MGKKEVEEFEGTLLFGKYRLCRVLGRGRSGTVYLARHVELEEYRAIKQVPKARVDYEQFRKEALILKSIRHPGIPVVYDLEEDEDSCYLIEEFLEGDSLYALVSCMGHFSKAMTIRYGIQICHLVNILHSSRPIPILYLDLQPENLLVCHNTVKLVDFDHAVHLNEAGRLTKRYGTVGFAAPEQYTEAVLDERTDIYSIGAILYYMLTGEFPGKTPSYRREEIDRPMARIIQSCLKENPRQRYASVAQLGEKLERIQEQAKKKRQGVFRENQRSSFVIAVAGAAPGVGTTHVAIGLAAYLMRQGLPILYEEKNDSGAVAQMADRTGAVMDQYRIYHVHGLPMLPLYDKTVKPDAHPYSVVIRDYGTFRDLFLQDSADGHLLVCGSKPWQWEKARDAVQFPGNPPGMAIIYNQFCRQFMFRLPGPAKEAESFLLPNYSHPFYYGKSVRKVYEEVFLSLSGKQARENFMKNLGAPWGL